MIRKILLFTLLVSGLGACGDDGTGTDDTELESVTAGTYTLQSIDGAPLPFVIVQVLADKVEVTAGHITLNADLTCSDSITEKTTENGVVSTDVFTDLCTYTSNAGAVTVTYPSDGSVIGGSIVGSQLTLSEDGFVFIFQK